MLVAGDTLLLGKPNGQPQHLWVLLTSSDPVSGEVIIVNLTSRRFGSDTTVILSPGDHPFIVRETVVYYADAREAELAKLEDAIKIRAAIAMPRMSGDLLKRVQEGLMKSEFTAKSIRTAFQMARSNRRA